MANTYKNYLVIFLIVSELLSLKMDRNLIDSNFMQKWQPISITKAIKLFMYSFIVYPLLLFAVSTITMYSFIISIITIISSLINNRFYCYYTFNSIELIYKAINIKWVIICSSSSISSGAVLSRPKILYVMIVAFMCAMASFFLFPVVKQLYVYILINMTCLSRYITSLTGSII